MSPSHSPKKDPPVDSVLFVGFGGPTASDEVMPFLRRVVEGRDVPEERLMEVARHYEIVGGRSPYNELTQSQARALRCWLSREGTPLPVYVGMRNWDPCLPDTVSRMAREGRKHAAGIILSSHRSQTSWERYMGDVESALASSEREGPAVTYLDPWFDDPGFLEASACRIEQVTGYRRGVWPGQVPVVFTAHSIPTAMAEDSPYVSDLMASCGGVARLLGAADWQLAYQSRSGSPNTPWLEPDIRDVLKGRAGRGTREVVLQAIGFLSDHVEVLFDLDVEAAALCGRLGMKYHRAPCVDSHPAFIAMLGARVLRMVAGSR